MPIRVLFDTNAFADEAFEKLEKSRLEILYRQKRVVPVYSGVFMEETLQSYGSALKRPVLLGRWMPFIFNTCDKVCDDLSAIIYRELIQGKGTKTDISMPNGAYTRLLAFVAQANSDGSWPIWHASRPEHEQK